MKTFFALPLALLFVLTTAFNTQKITHRIELSADEVKAAQSLFDLLPAYKSNACQELEYTLTYVPYRQDPLAADNYQASFSSTTRQYLQQAKSNDYYYLDPVSTTCNGQKVRLEGYVIKVNN